MKKRWLIGLIVMFLVLVIGAGYFFLIFSQYFRGEKFISGYVADCQTGQPIESVEVGVYQSGWGKSDEGSIVWDKNYEYIDHTDENGFFNIAYRVGTSAKIRAKKVGYYSAEQWASPNSEVTIRMLMGKDPLEYTNDCKFYSECLVCKMIEGSKTCWNNCTNPNLR